jgi:hypothetical protein
MQIIDQREFRSAYQARGMPQPQFPQLNQLGILRFEAYEGAIGPKADGGCP